MQVIISIRKLLKTLTYTIHLCEFIESVWGKLSRNSKSNIRQLLHSHESRLTSQCFFKMCKISIIFFAREMMENNRREKLVPHIFLIPPPSPPYAISRRKIIERRVHFRASLDSWKLLWHEMDRKIIWTRHSAFSNVGDNRKMQSTKSKTKQYITPRKYFVSF